MRLTAHAHQRLRERFPGIRSREVLNATPEATLDTAVTGKRACALRIRGRVMWAVQAADGGILTLLEPGQHVITPTGRIKLHRPALPPGLHRIDPDVYHADRLGSAPSLSSTLARTLLNRSPRHAWTASPRLNPDWAPVEKKVFDVGRAAHAMLLGVGEFAVYPTECLDRAGNATTADAKAWAKEARRTGVTPLKADEEAACIRMVDAVRRAMREARLPEIDPARAELTAYVEIDGCAVRAMFDHLPEDGPIFDLKTARNATPSAAVRAVEDYGLDHQAAHYTDALAKLEGERRPMLFAFVEKEPPHEVGFVKLADMPGQDVDWMEDARQKAAEARRLWVHCLREDDWPGYDRRVATIGARGFFRDRWAPHEARPDLKPKPTAQALDTARAWQAPEGVI